MESRLQAVQPVPAHRLPSQRQRTLDVGYIPMAADLDADIQYAWHRATTTLRGSANSQQEIADLIAALRDCAARAKAVGFESGQTELLRMARYLEGRIAPSAFPSYSTN
jgi:hypothetical protein